MKKLFSTLAMTLCMAAPTMAQEEDVTHYIMNPGFDEDLTFQVNGSMKEAISTDQSLSDRSWAYIAADSTVYARPKSTSGQSRSDGRKLEAVNGFKGRVKGWVLESNAEFPKCEWTYFGTVPYDLQPESVPIADDGTTYLVVPERPTEFDGGEGFVYLRAGWTNSAVYKQEVKLPCAVYRLEYWTININPNTSAVAADLTKIVCRRDEFKDEEGTGLNAQEWTKHEFEFTPVDKFSLQFGYQAANAGSGGQPIVALDGIKLYRIGDADPVDLLREDMVILSDTLENEFQSTLLGTNGDPFYGLMDEAADLADQYYYEGSDIEQLQSSIAQLNAAIAQIHAGYEAALRCEVLYNRIQNLLGRAETYPGLEALTLVADDAYQKLYDQGGADSETMIALEKQLQDAILAYYQSQEPTMDSPANYSFLVQHPWFCNDGREPASNAAGDVAAAALLNEDKNADGWVNGSTASATTGAWFNVGRTCYQLWATNFTGYLDVHQQLTDIPNGIYSLQADLITNADALSDQHIYATSALGTTEGFMTEAGVCWDWASGAYTGSYPEDGTEPWETVTTEGTVIVTDGQLTIGARSTHNTPEEDISAGQRAGSFWMTNFVLRYHGPATDDQIAAAIQENLDKANSLAASMHFAADQAAVYDSIAVYQSTQDFNVLAGGMSFGQTSEAKYEEIMAEGKTIPTVAQTLAEEGDAAYGVAHDIVAFASEKTQQWLNSSEATYRDADARIALMKGYTLTYTDAYLAADEALNELSTRLGREAIQNVMNYQKSALLSADTLAGAATVDAFVAELNNTVRVARAQQAYEENAEGDDYTAFIQNPDAAAETGWTLVRGTGNNNTNAGQHYTGDAARRYFDSYNSTAGALNFYGEQRIEGLPNGTYTVRAAVRTSGEGAFLFTANGGAEKADTTFVEIPFQTYTYFDEEQGEEVTANATDHYGAIWEDAFQKMNDGTADEMEMAIATANAVQGFGWEWLAIEGVEVRNHVLVIGFTTDVARTGKEFTGTWFSATDFTLTQTAAGDNADWTGPIDGVESVKVNSLATDGIFDLSGRRIADAQKAGLYILIQNGKAQKVLRR